MTNVMFYVVYQNKKKESVLKQKYQNVNIHTEMAMQFI